MASVPFVMKKFSLIIYDSFCFKDPNVRCRGEELGSPSQLGAEN